MRATKCIIREVIFEVIQKSGAVEAKLTLKNPPKPIYTYEKFIVLYLQFV